MISNPLEQKINEYLQIPGTDRTDEQNAFLLFADIIKQYEGIKSPEDITEEIEQHYYSIKNKELTAEHREIFTDISIDVRQNDYENPCKPGIHQWKDKGEAIDRFCDVLNIKRNKPFHGQIKQTEIYEEDVKASDWYRYVMKYQFELIQLFGYEIGIDFGDNPLKYFKTFCLKVMGISCKLNQTKGLCTKEHEPLFKQHMREDIYRKHYGGTPRAITTKKRHSDDWINKKISNGDELTIAEKQFRTMRRHVEIHRKQPQYKRYMLNPGESPLLKYKSEEQIKKIKHYGGTSR